MNTLTLALRSLRKIPVSLFIGGWLALLVSLTLTQTSVAATRQLLSPVAPLPISGREIDSRALMEYEKLIASDGESNDLFGNSLALSSDGTLALIGAPQDGDLGDFAGAAYIFTWDGFTWIEQQKLTASDGVSVDGFGFAVALSADGTTALIGAPFAGGSSGAAYVFTLDGSTWVEQQKLTASDATEDALFGYSMALSADASTLLIGAVRDSEYYTYGGAAYVFAGDGISWTQQTKLTPTEGAGLDEFGRSVALSADGTVALIGAPLQDAVGEDAGAAYFFLFEEPVWVEKQRVTASSGTNFARFGESVALNLDGTIVLIGAPDDDTANGDAGAAYGFAWTGLEWTEQQQLIASDANGEERFGYAVSLDAAGTTALIGVLDDDDLGSNSGSAYVLIGDGGTWAEDQKLLASDGIAFDAFGIDVALNQDASMLLISAQFGDGTNGDEGAVYAFIPEIIEPTGTPTRTATITEIPATPEPTLAATPTATPPGFTNCGAVSTISIGECQALVALYNNTNGPGWTNRTGWLTHPDPCMWYGVGCAGGHVSGLELANNALLGSIPAELGDLSLLTMLNLFQNHLTGGIPAALENLSSLQILNLGRNLNLSGTIPPELGNLSQLQSLSLYDMNLTGTIPAELGNLGALTVLELHRNHLSGGIPSALGNLTSLTTLNLSGNLLTGDIPAAFASLTNLQAGSTSVDYNRLTGVDPGVIALLDMVNPGWNATQTIPPTNVGTVSDPVGLKITWTPILYSAHGGNYFVTCTDGVNQVTTTTADKTSAEATISGLPAAIYTCGVSSYTPAHASNQNELTSAEAFAPSINYAGQPVPPNDLIADPIVFDGYQQQNHSLNIASATRSGDPVPPDTDPLCPVNIPADAVGIHYRISGNSPDFGDSAGIVITAGGPIWFSNRAVAERETADTAIVVYEESAVNTVGAIVACDDDHAPGEISISSARFDLDPAKTYRVVVWNEGIAVSGAIIELAEATFDLFTPADDSVQATTPATFTWQPYTGAVSYYFTVGLTTELSKYTLVERTPAADGDELTCVANLCTLTVVPGSDLAGYLDEGNFLWTVAASLSDDDPTIPLYDSNQSFRLVIGTPKFTPLSNGGFEIATENSGQPAGWTGKNLSKDKLKCNKPDKVVAHTGECAYQFKGGSDEKASLAQEVDATTYGAGDQVKLTAWGRGKGIVSQTKIVINVRYQDQSRTKAKVAFPVGDLVEYTLFSSSVIELIAPADSIKVKINHKNLTGKLILDDIELTITQGGTRSSPLPLPLPETEPASHLGQR